MKKMLILSTVLASVATMAQTTTTANATDTTSTETITSSFLDKKDINGFLFGISKGFEEKAKIKASFMGQSASGSDDDLSHKLGLVAGYAKHNEGSLGYMAKVQYDFYKSDDNEEGDGQKFAMIEGSGDATFMINQHLIPYAGINISKYTKGDDLKDLDAGIGWQLGVTGQIINQVAYNLDYSIRNNEGDIDGLNIDIEMKAVHVGITVSL
jgi:hypothetical protein